MTSSAGFRLAFGQLLLGYIVMAILTGVSALPGLAIMAFPIFMMVQHHAPEAGPMLVATLGFIVAMIPAIYLSISWMFSLPLIIDKQMEFWPAMSASRKMVGKHWWLVFGLVVVCGLINLAGFLACCVGLFVQPAHRVRRYRCMPMRASFLRPPRGPLSRSTARNAALLNQCATPGLGSLMAGRRLAGIGQLLLAVAGFVMIIGWFVLLALQIYNQLINDAPTKSVAWLGEAGAVIFVAAWLWSLVTSLSVLREARANERKSATPPVISRNPNP